ncbi:sedoheptulokinase [Cohnella pontilimi]|nr:FGGY family carbohydrate kinase [Cohnella pontilimi]
MIGLDIGTTSICGVLMDASSKQIVQAITKENRAALRSSHAWEFVQDPARIMDAILEIVSELSHSRAEIGGIGVTGQMHGILYVDQEGRAVSPLYTWQDQRGDLPYPGESAAYAEHLSRLTGYPLSTGYGMVTHVYNLMNGLVPKEAAALCTIADYAAMRLANRPSPLIDSTNAAALGLFDLKALKFDQAALAACRIDPAMIPEVAMSGSVIGHTADGVPVSCALGDNQASFLGSVQDVRSTLLLNIGTGAQLSAYIDEYVSVDGLDTRPFPGGGYLLVGASLSGGKSYSLLERFFREVCSMFVGYDGAELYEIMNRVAEEQADKEGAAVRVNTQFFGTRQNPLQRGSIADIGPDNFTVRNLVHGFLDGMIDELHRFYEAFPAPIRDRIRTLVASGNGIRRNPALRRKLEQVFGYSPTIPASREEASRGAALCAAVGFGKSADFFHL